MISSPSNEAAEIASTYAQLNKGEEAASKMEKLLDQIESKMEQIEQMQLQMDNNSIKDNNNDNGIFEFRKLNDDLQNLERDMVDIQESMQLDSALVNKEC
ncbi:hypothetical protein DAPK24_030780 [Pichia kluyveri]|uniref:Uncharacterized protein n=1 Tax=Pichia kluyveri TaxID=36015 RepID=A0AAV5R4N0_PICKL|nr:hypothetical protein DAPK24_030780 [Pichia kluyveri]